MDWATARTALVTKLHAATFQASGFASETLGFFALPPTAEQTEFSAYGYVIPPARAVRRLPGGTRIREISEIRCRFITSAETANEGAARMEALIEKLTDLVGDAIGFEGTAGAVITTQTFTEFSTFGPEGAPPYGFEMTLGAVILDTETRSV